MSDKKKQATIKYHKWYDKYDNSDIVEMFRPITKSEHQAVIKNRIAERKFAREYRFFSSEHRYNIVCIKQIIIDSGNALKKLQASTGNYTYSASPLQTRRVQSSRKVLDKYYKHAKLVASNPHLASPTFQQSTSLLENFDLGQPNEKKRVSSAQPTTNFLTSLIANEPSEMFMSPSPSAKNTLRPRTGQRRSQSINNLDTFFDTSITSGQTSALQQSRQQQSSTVGASTPIPMFGRTDSMIRTPSPAVRANRLASMKPKENNMSMSEAKKLFPDIKIEDKELKRVYDELCHQRAHIPKYSAEHIEMLKRHDPVFAKRYKQYQTAKMCNRAPLFDYNDYLLPMVASKSTVSRQKHEIVRNTSMKYELPAKFKLELQQIDMKVKNYIKNMPSF